MFRRLSPLVTFLFLIVILTACSPASPPPAETHAPNTPLPTPPPEPPAGWAAQWSALTPVLVSPSLSGIVNTYNDAAGFVLDFPNNWFAYANSHPYALASFDMNGPGTGGIADDQAKLEILVDRVESATNVADLLTLMEQSGEATIEEIQRLQLVDGTPAARLVLQGGPGETRVLLAIINGYRVGIYGYGNAEMIDDVANSLRAYPPKPTVVALPTPNSDEPASGICADPGEAGTVVLTLNADGPDPRCAKVRPDQQIQVVNNSGADARLALSYVRAEIQPGENMLLAGLAGSYMLPGVYIMEVNGAPGPEVWLTEEAGQEKWKSYTSEEGVSVDYPAEWIVKSYDPTSVNFQLSTEFGGAAGISLEVNSRPVTDRRATDPHT